MARESLTDNSRFAAALATPGSAGAFFQARSATGQASTLSGSFPVNHPYTWLRLQRSGSLFTGFASLDGQAWQTLGRLALPLPEIIYFGMAVSSRNTNETAAVQFRDLAGAGGEGMSAVPLSFEPISASSRRTGLVISEIMHHAEERADGKNLQFVEIYNSQVFYEDISGYRLAGDMEYVFPPGTVLQAGAFSVIAYAPADLKSVYGLSAVLGPFAHPLPADAGTVQVRNRRGAVLLDARYDSEPPWPKAADGAGHSLVLSRPSFGEHDARAWKASDIKGGSPGQPESVGPEPLRTVLINEFLAHPAGGGADFLELYNRSADPVDLSGAFLSDNPSTNKFRIPEGTLLPPRGFASFTEAQLGFGLGARGESIYFVNRAQSRVIDAVSFAGQAPGISTGRDPDGAPTLRALRATTPGAANSPRLGPDVVINEIMYHPISELKEDEYIELHNRGTHAIRLDGWKMSDGISFIFPPNTLLPERGYLVIAQNLPHLLTSYPQLNLANTFGDYNGTLGNSGERLVLSRPEQILTTNLTLQTVTTNTYFIDVDTVTDGQGGAGGNGRTAAAAAWS